MRWIVKWNVIWHCYKSYAFNNGYSCIGGVWTHEGFKIQSVSNCHTNLGYNPTKCFWYSYYCTWIIQWSLLSLCLWGFLVHVVLFFIVSNLLVSREFVYKFFLLGLSQNNTSFSICESVFVRKASSRRLIALPCTTSWMLLVPESFQMHRTSWYLLAFL